MKRFIQTIKQKINKLKKCLKETTQTKNDRQREKLLSFADSLFCEYPRWELTYFCYDDIFKRIELKHDKGIIRPAEDMQKFIDELKPRDIGVSFASDYWRLVLKFESDW